MAFEIRKTKGHLALTIATATTNSVQLGGMTKLAVEVPAASNAETVKFQAMAAQDVLDKKSDADATFFDVVTLAATSGRIRVLTAAEAEAIAPFSVVRIVMGGSAGNGQRVYLHTTS